MLAPVETAAKNKGKGKEGKEKKGKGKKGGWIKYLDLAFNFTVLKL